MVSRKNSVRAVHHVPVFTQRRVQPMSALTTIAVIMTKEDSALRDSALVCRAMPLSSMAAIVHVTTIIIMVRAISLVRVMVSVLRVVIASVLNRVVMVSVLRVVTASALNRAVMVSVLNRAVMVSVLNRVVMVALNRVVTVVLNRAVMVVLSRVATTSLMVAVSRRVLVSTLLITIQMQSIQ
jgi:hypothetical protein